MNKRPSRHIVSLVSMLIFLLSGQAGVQGYVWCVGENGHAALEYVAKDSCAPIDQKQDRHCHGEKVSDRPFRERHCGPCADLPASFDATSRRLHDPINSHVGAAASVAAGVSPFPTLLRVYTGNLYPHPPPRISQTILSHHTVVLLV